VHTIIVAAIAGAIGFYGGIGLMCALRMWDKDQPDRAPKSSDRHA
jgi:hypothetical protein